MIELTKKQQEAVDVVVKRFKQRLKHTIIAGYAGTGKTTCINSIIEALVQDCNIKRNRICVAAYTGKAAQVLINKGYKNVVTLHRLLYDSVLTKEGTYIHKLKQEIEYSVVIVDEISMVNEKMLKQLIKKAKYIIGIGDPFQLPPISGQGDILLQNPHVFLDEITRQAAQSPIIQLSMKIRNGEPITYTQNDEVQVLKKSELTEGMLLWADQIICATNKVRNKVNTKMRELLNKEGDLDEGEKIICLSNYWDKVSSNQSDYALTNGVIGTIENVYPSFVQIPYFIGGGQRVYTVNGNFTAETGQKFRDINIDRETMVGNDYGIDGQMLYKLKTHKKYKWIPPLEFTYGYCVTCWKAQGSEWDKVLILEENFPFDKKEHLRFLYTAVTRARKKVVLVKN